MGNGIFILLRSQLRWLAMPVQFSIANFLFSVVTLLSTIIFLIIMNFGLIGVFLGQIVGSIIGIIVSFYYLRGTFSFFFEIGKLKELLRFSSPLVPLFFPEFRPVDRSLFSWVLLSGYLHRRI
jgi:hypothetical protein